MTARTLKFVMNDLHVETCEFLKKTLIEWFVFHEKTNITLRRMFVETAVGLDMTSEDPILSGAEQIVVGAFIKRFGGSVPQYSPEAVEEFIQMVISGEEPTRLDEWFGAVTRRLEIARSVADDMQPDHIRYLAVLYGMIGPEHSPADLMVMHRAHGMKWIQGLAKLPEFFSKLMERSDFVRELLAGIDLTEPRYYHALIEYLKNHPPPQEVRKIILKYLERQVESPDRDVKLTAFHWLMFFSDWFDEEDRTVFRKRFHQFFETERPSLDAWSLRYIDHYRSDLGRILMHRGEQVAWEEDALSAAYSWSSEIHDDLAIFPWSDYQASSIFRHLFASSCLFTPPGWGEAELVPVLMDDIAPNRAFHDPFPSPLIEVTPWQRARSLHLRRPDLKFPDRPIFRPLGKRVHLHDYKVMVDP